MICLTCPLPPTSFMDGASYTAPGRPRTTASRGARGGAAAASAARRPRTAGNLNRSVASVGGEEFTRGDPLLEAVDRGELGDEAAVRVLKAKLKVTMVRQKCGCCLLGFVALL